MTVFPTQSMISDAAPRCTATTLHKWSIVVPVHLGFSDNPDAAVEKLGGSVRDYLESLEGVEGHWANDPCRRCVASSSRVVVREPLALINDYRHERLYVGMNGFQFVVRTERLELSHLSAPE